MKVEDKSGSKRTLSLQAGMFVLAQSAALLLIGLRNYPPPCHRGKSLNLWGYGQR